MRSRVPAYVAAVFVLVSPSLVAAQASTTWRVRFTDEVTGRRDNLSSPFASPTRDVWSSANEILAAGDATWMPHARLKVGAGVAFHASSGGKAGARVREAYARASVLSWLDVEMGKRLSRWGTGYAFTPTGVLDPPRDATDPQDRLGLNEGMVLLRADGFRGASAVTLAVAAPRLNRTGVGDLVPRRLAAVRVRTTLRGVELAGVGAAATGRAVSFGGNFTHVVGRRFEYHGEVLAHDAVSVWRRVLEPGAPVRRTVSALVGLQYTFGVGANLVVEYYRDGNGLDSVLWNRLVRAAEARRALDAQVGSLAAADGLPAVRPARRHMLFTRLSRANGDATILPEWLTLVGLEDGGVTMVPSLTLAVSSHIQPYVRVVGLFGRARSSAASAPTTAVLSGGATVRF
ncbi:MAG: hypothetical protein U0Q12_05830 [Vicinamibacterales bacterium]